MKRGRVEFRADKGSVVHVPIGKVRCTPVAKHIPQLALSRHAQCILPQLALPDAFVSLFWEEGAVWGLHTGSAPLAVLAPTDAAPVGSLVQVTFETKQLVENAGALVDALLNARPAKLKGSGASGYLLRVSMSSTMGPSVPVLVKSLVAVRPAKP